MQLPQNKSPAAIPMFSGDISFMGCSRIDPQKEIPQGSLVVLGIPFDTSTSNRPGARFGPRGIRIASKMISWQKLYPWEEDIYGTEVKAGVKVFDGGDIDFDFGRGESVIEATEKTISHILSCGARPLILGGDHFISYPIMRSLYRYFKHSLALIHFDAHYDMWDDDEAPTIRIDHGTGFYHALKEGILNPEHSIQIGLRTHKQAPKNGSGGSGIDQKIEIESIDAFEADGLTAEEIVERIYTRVGDAPAYLTFDIDCLDPAFAPGTGTPVCGGFTTLKVLDILWRLRRSGGKGLDIRGGDIVEVSPPYDQGEITSLSGATVAAYVGHLLIAGKK